jgi:hypothetical protein
VSLLELGQIHGSCGGNVVIERRRRDAETVRDLRHADVGIGEHRLDGLDAADMGPKLIYASKLSQRSKARD